MQTLCQSLKSDLAIQPADTEFRCTMLALRAILPVIRYPIFGHRLRTKKGANLSKVCHICQLYIVGLDQQRVFQMALGRILLGN